MVHRWVFYDPHMPETWTVPINPREMTSPFPERSIQALGTTAIGGRTLVWERPSEPKVWEFRGAILDHEHYEQLRYWTYDKRQRITITDHFGRPIQCLLLSFDPEPRRALNHQGLVYWRHDYTCRAMVFSVGEATVMTGA